MKITCVKCDSTINVPYSMAKELSGDRVLCSRCSLTMVSDKGDIGKCVMCGGEVPLPPGMPGKMRGRAICWECAGVIVKPGEQMPNLEFSTEDAIYDSEGFQLTEVDPDCDCEGCRLEKAMKSTGVPDKWWAVSSADA